MIDARFSMKLLLIMALAIAPFCRGQAQNLAFNGELWRQLTPDQKLALVMGYDFGYETGFIEASPSKKSHSVVNPMSISFAQMKDGLDICYKDFRNRQVKIQFCVIWVLQGVRGMSDADREKSMEGNRAITNR